MKWWRMGLVGWVCVMGCVAQGTSAMAAVVSVNFDGLSTYLTGANVETQQNADGTTGYYNRNASGILGQGGEFTTDGVSFNSQLSYDDMYKYYYWSGFAISNVKNTTTAGIVNQFGAYTDERMSENYLVGFMDIYNDGYPTISLTNGDTFESIWLCNTTYAAMSIQYGDDFARPFGAGDHFDLILHGTDAAGNTLEQTVSLANYPTGGNLDLIDDWTEVNLRELGFAGDTIWMSLETTNMSEWGANTPMYFAVGGMTVNRETPQVPEPTTWMMLAGIGIVGMTLRRRAISPTAR